MVTVSQSSSVPSLTQMVALYTPGVVEVPGVQLKAPVVGSIAAPAGAPVPKDQVSGSPSTSAALGVKLSVPEFATVLGPISAKTGASLTDVTVIETVAVLLSASPSLAL